MMNRIAIDITRAITPRSLFGIDLRIAYANRMYHSGWICCLYVFCCYHILSYSL